MIWQMSYLSFCLSITLVEWLNRLGLVYDLLDINRDLLSMCSINRSFAISLFLSIL